MIQHGTKAQEAIRSFTAKFTAMKLNEKISLTYRDRDPSIRGLRRIPARGSSASKSRSAQKSREKPPTAKHHPVSVIHSASITPALAAKAAPVVEATIRMGLRYSIQKNAKVSENRA
jgi:hypothetical protein